MKRRAIVMLFSALMSVSTLLLVHMSSFTGRDDVLALCSSDATDCIPEATSIFRATRNAVYYPKLSELTPPVGWSYLPYPEVKYFQEADGISHADARFYNEKYFRNPYVRKAREKSMLAAFSKFSDKFAIPYWLAHGTLIGYHFNQQMLPWDNDVDLQMTYGALVELVKYNQTRFGESNFLMIDVNPNMNYRAATSQNTIDARIIDAVTGAFMDITAIAAVQLSKFSKPYYSCKSPHHYAYKDLFPLHRTEFEGIPTWRPNNVESILTDEYGSGVFNTHFRNFEFNGTAWNNVG